MPILFNDSQNLKFKYYDVIPSKTINLRLFSSKNQSLSLVSEKEKEPAYKLNLAALHFYGFYRNALCGSYEKKDLAEDIKNYKKGSKYTEVEG